MDLKISTTYDLLADAFEYPGPGSLAALETGLETLPAGSQKQAMVSFLKKIRRLSLGEWEELYTRTLDLNPPAAPYIGFQTWGESYQRGEFMAKMNRKLMETGVDPEGELPDHLAPVLRYLGQTQEPLPELVEILNPAVQRMLAVLSKADPANPYLDLFEAALELCKGMKKEAA